VYNNNKQILTHDGHETKNLTYQPVEVLRPRDLEGIAYTGMSVVRTRSSRAGPMRENWGPRMIETGRS
jgi:hypothetical protein